MLGQIIWHTSRAKLSDRFPDAIDIQEVWAY